MYQTPHRNLGGLLFFGIGSGQPPLRREPTRALGQRSSLRGALLLLLASFAFFGVLACPAQSIVIDSFNAGATTGSVRAGSSWVGNVTQNATSLTVGGTATDVNGWGATGLSLNATGMNFLTISGQRDSGHAATSFSILFEDRNLNTQVFSVSATAFSADALTLVQIAIPRWNSGFDAAQITGWSIGGGSLGLAAFRMTLDQILLSTTALAGGAVAPVIAGEIGARTLSTGESVTFTVTATGTAPLTYQWYLEGVAIAHSTSATYAINFVRASDAGRYTVAVTNASGTTTSAAANLTVNDLPTNANLTATQATESTAYAAGRTISLTNTVTYTGTLSSFGWQLVLPTGWSYASSSGANQEVQPTVGQVNLLEWAWATVPASPFNFTVVVAAPTDSAGTQGFSALALSHVSGVAYTNLVTPSPLTIPSLAVLQGTVHSADTNADMKFSLGELLRVIELYNYRNGTTRTGAYTEQHGTEDGFVPGPDGGLLTKFHSADTNIDGKLSLGELLRVIELYNYRVGTTRTGQYRPQAGTEDGFDPGP